MKRGRAQADQRRAPRLGFSNFGRGDPDPEFGDMLDAIDDGDDRSPRTRRDRWNGSDRALRAIQEMGKLRW